MVTEPAVECIRKGYGYATSLSDLLHWWHTLPSADQGAWAAGIGATAAAVIALLLAFSGAIRNYYVRRTRGRMVAAYLYMPFARIEVALKLMSMHGMKYASVMAGNQSLAVQGDAKALRQLCEDIRIAMQTFRVSDAMELPHKIGEGLAIAVGELALVLDSYDASLKSYFVAAPDEHQVRFDAAHNQSDVLATVGTVLERVQKFTKHCLDKLDKDH